jgi:preprotein translocase subunit YajC
MLLALQTLLAEAAGDASQAPQGSGLFTFLPLVAIVVLGYFLLVRPMRRQEQERKALLSTLKKNDKVITSGGLIGIVASIKDNEDEVTLKVDESSNVRLRVTKGSIVRIVSREEPAKEQKESSQ